MGFTVCVLLERERVLRRIEDLLEDATTTRGRLVALGGEAGVGKSTVVDAVLERARARLPVAVGHCDNVAAPAALGPLIEALPSVADLVEQHDDRATLFRCLLNRLAREPALLVLEDVHWADEATLDLLRYLGRRVEGLPVLLIATYRDDEVRRGHPLAVVLGDLASAAGMVRIDVPALSADGVRSLAAAAGSVLDPLVLHERTGGNAFYVTEVLAAGDDTVPATVRDAVLARVSRLPEDAAGVLAAAAVLGQPADVGLLATVSGRGPDAVDACARAGLLVPVGPSWGFRHELARLAVLETLLPAERSHLHARALAALLARGEHDEHLLVVHADGCGDSAAVRRYARPAAERSARLGAHREAVELYRTALRHHPARDAERARVCAALSYECYLVDRLEDALAARREAMELADDPRTTGEHERWLSRLSWYLGRGDDARRWMAQAVRTLERVGDGPELAMAYSNRAQMCMLAFDTVGAVGWGRRALEVARRVGDRDTEIHALNNVGSALAVGGDHHDGISLLERSRDLALAADADEHVARAYTNLATSSTTTRHLRDAERYLEAGIAYCIERDLDSWVHYMRAWQTQVAADLGRFDEAERLAADLLQLPGLPPIVRIPAAVTAAQVAHRCGRDARVLLEEATRLAVPTGEVQRLAPTAAGWAELAWLEGRTGDIEAAVDIAWAAAATHPQQWQLAELAWWSSLAGVRREVTAPPPEPFALMLNGSWQAAADAWRSLGLPYWEALALGRDPRLDAARRALEILDSLGACTARTAVVRDRRAAGLPVPRGPRVRAAGGAGLTPRELEVLALLVDGLSDAAIASALVLSTKTVGHHVSAVLRKLDVPTRSRAAAEARRRGLLESEALTAGVRAHADERA